ncbi:MAG: single-stranded-DNA-specific exonuclease RecJ [Clostridiales bacterium]|jgi:single-stranded-DNA-specific exonuclease RecJ|nr:single-stranded-DNA-specific exonuclease RecJ [Clostridiales bacterium]
MDISYKKRKTNDESLVASLAESTGLSRLAADLLASRGIETEEDAKRFLNPCAADFLDPFLMPDMRAAVERIERALKNREKIVVYGDYDCDGVSAAAILYDFFRDKTETSYYIPSRKDGYGLSAAAIDKIAESVFPDLIITVDCGVTSVGEVEYIKELGIDAIITDHHTPQDALPDAPVLNPKVGGYGNELCGAGVALKLVEALAGFKEAERYMDIAAIATVGDMVPLTGENRAITALGLEKMNVKSNIRKGLKNLFSSLKLDKITASDIAFTIAPRLNAAGRMGLADRALELLVSEDYFNIECLIKELNADNAERQTLLSDVTDDVYERLLEEDLNASRCIVLADARWDGGILGLACSKTAGEFNRPALLFTEKDGVLKGSARSVEGINIFEALSGCKGLFTAFGGHAQAAGVSLPRENFAAFKQKINEYMRKYGNKPFLPSAVYDAAPKEKPDLETVRELRALEPFGEGNPRPVFWFKNREMRFTRIKGTSHIKERSGTFETVGFNMADGAELLNSLAEKNLFATADCCAYNNAEYVKAVIQCCYASPPEECFDKVRLLEAYLSAAAANGRNLIVQNGEEINGANSPNGGDGNGSLTQNGNIACGANSPNGKDERGSLIQNDKNAGKNVSERVKRFEKDGVSDIIKDTDEIYGTAFVAFDDRTAAEFYKKFRSECDKLLLFCYRAPESRNPYNRLFLSPKDLRFNYYGRVVYLDKPLFDPTAYSSARGIFVCSGENPLDGALRSIGLNGERIRELYIRIRGGINGGAEGLRGIYSQSAGDKKFSYTEFVAAFAVFYELGLIETGKNGVKLNEKKTDLENSSVYRKCTRTADGESGK